MRSCSVTKKLQIVPGCLDDYKELAHFHYRDSHLGPYAAIFALKPNGRHSEKPPVKLGAKYGTTYKQPYELRTQNSTVGVIVYTMPSPGLELRGIATGNLFAGFDKATQLALINKNIRRISRVIIEPRFRTLGLASRLVRETMPQINVPIIEAMAVMGKVNPFFEKAGMAAYTAKIPKRCVQLLEALSMVGIEKEELLDSQKVHHKLEQLQGQRAEFIELQIKRFLASYGKRRNMAPVAERTRYILSKLTDRPVYYIWFNPKLVIGNW